VGRGGIDREEKSQLPYILPKERTMSENQNQAELETLIEMHDQVENGNDADSVIAEKW
jgi:hypothetical protein